MSQVEKRKYDKTVVDLVEGELYEIRPRAQLFNISNADINSINRENIPFLFLEKYKIDICTDNIQDNKIEEEYFVVFLYGNIKYVLKIEKGLKYFYHHT